MKGVGIFKRLLVCFFFLSTFGGMQVVAQQVDATAVMQRVEAGFRKAGGIRVDFSMLISAGRSAGTIELEGEKFVLRAGGMTTWFDGHTQWSYLDSANEVNISEPTAEELQMLNPYAWMSLYRDGYRAQFFQPAQASDALRYYCVQLVAATGDVGISLIRLYVRKNTFRPERIVLREGVEDVEIQVGTYQENMRWNDGHFVFDVAGHPGVEIIDLR